MSDLARRLDIPLTTVQDEVTRLLAGGVLTSRKIGRARLVRAADPSPYVDALRQLTLVTFGPQIVIAEEFHAAGFARVVLFGSWAARFHGVMGAFPRDIDVLVLTDDVDRTTLFHTVKRSEDRLVMQVNAVVRPAVAWDNPGDDPLLAEIQANPHVELTTEERGSTAGS